MSAAPVVLVVDDDASNIAILAHVLESEYDVAFATNGAEALALVRAQPPDLILLDVMMPEMDGHEVCRQLKGDPATAGIPVIFLTGLDEHDAASFGLELGAADYLTKPFNAGVVRARVRHQLELKNARDMLLALEHTDGLTGLANRRRFDDVLALECRRLARSRGTIALLLFDVDAFKAYNDTYGHLAGDDCLRSLAGVVGGAMQRASDLAARYGGEAFAAVLAETALAGAVAVAERIRTGVAALAIPHAASAVAPVVTFSIGVAAVACAPGMLPEEVIARADACLSRAKDGGRNRIVSDSG